MFVMVLASIVVTCVVGIIVVGVVGVAGISVIGVVLSLVKTSFAATFVLMLGSIA